MEFFVRSFPTTIYLMVVAVICIVMYLIRASKKKAAREATEKVRLEAEEHVMRQRLAENARRQKLREEWHKDNKVILYFKMIKGIKVVVLPEDYIQTQEPTAMMRLDERWKNSHVLIPIRRSFVFVNSSGLDLLKANVGSLTKETYTERMNGWLSDLEKLVQSEMIALEERPDLFVPWVDSNLLSMYEQSEKINKACHPDKLYTDMVLPRVPEHLRPL